LPFHAHISASGENLEKNFSRANSNALITQRTYVNLPSEPFTPSPLGKRKDKRKSSTDWTKFISLEIIEQKLGITQPEEWLTVNLTDARDVGLPKWVKIPQLVDLLKQRYPSQDWHKISITKGRYGKQRRVQHAIESLFTVTFNFSG